MIGTDAFFDTNVLLYAISDDARKAQASDELIRAGGVISVQVLTEFVDIARRKHDVPWPKLRDILQNLEELCSVEVLTTETHRRALAISERYGFRIFDSMIVAAAAIANCTILYSEDMRTGLTIDRLTIRNPFTRT